MPRARGPLAVAVLAFAAGLLLSSRPAPVDGPKGDDGAAVTGWQGNTLRLRVVDEDDRPVAGADVLLMTDRYGVPEGGRPVGSATTDDRGLVSIEVEERERDYWASASRAASPGGPERWGATGYHPVLTTIRVVPPGLILGTVRDEEGRPVPDVPIFMLSNGEWTEVLRSDDEGRFRMSGMPPAVVELAAVPRSWARWPSVGQKVWIAAARSDVVLPYRRPRDLRVKIEDYDPPLGSVRAELTILWPWYDDLERFVRRETVDPQAPDGYVLHDLIPGRHYNLRLRPAVKAPPTDVEITGEEGSVSVWIAGVLSIRGKVVLPDGDGMPFAHVDLTHAATGRKVRARGDERGEFEVGGLQNGDWRIRAWAYALDGHGYEGCGTARAGESCEIALERE